MAQVDCSQCRKLTAPISPIADIRLGDVLLQIRDRERSAFASHFVTPRYSTSRESESWDQKTCYYSQRKEMFPIARIVASALAFPRPWQSRSTTADPEPRSLDTSSSRVCERCSR